MGMFAQAERYLQEHVIARAHLTKADEISDEAIDVARQATRGIGVRPEILPPQIGEERIIIKGFTLFGELVLGLRGLFFGFDGDGIGPGQDFPSVLPCRRFERST